MKVIIYGAGDFGTMLLEQLASSKGEIEVIAVFDINPAIQGLKMFGHTVQNPKYINRFEYEKLYISVAERNTQFKIIYMLGNLGVPFDKIEFKFPQFIACGTRFNRDVDAPRVLWMKNFSETCIDKHGSVAECGVYQGDFAKRINRIFYNRRLYLFDSFNGFSENDLKAEYLLKNENFIGNRFDNIGMFSKTSTDVVMRKMPFPENIIIKEGYIPETLEGINDEFIFVNLDMDLYLPMFEALKFFWDRLVMGGMILVHDYFCAELPGVAVAVDDFEKFIGHRTLRMSIGEGSTLAIIKT